MVSAFRKIQVGIESTRGTGVAATKIWPGAMTIQQNLDIHRPSDADGRFAEFSRSRKVGQQAAINFQGDATYEQLIDFLLMGVKGAVTPTTPGTLSKLWTFTPNQEASNAQDAYTIEYGNDVQAWEWNFCMLESIDISFALNQVLAINATFFGRFGTKTTITPSITPPSPREVVARDGQVWIDPSWATLGTTLKSNLLLGGSIRLTTGLAPSVRMDGGLDYTGFKEGKRHIEADLDMLVGTDGITEYDAFAALTTRALRLRFSGDTDEIEASHTYEFTLDMVGEYTNQPTIFQDADGEDVISLTMASHRDSSDNEFSLEVKNKETAA